MKIYNTFFMVFFGRFVKICRCELRFFGDSVKLINVFSLFVIKVTADSLCDTNLYYWVWINCNLWDVYVIGGFVCDIQIMCL